MQQTQIEAYLRKPTLRPDEVAQLLEVSVRKVYQLIKDGVLPTVPGLARPKRIPTWAIKKMLFGNGERG